MRKLFTLYFLFTYFLCYSQTSTTSDGNWNTGGNWSNGVPDDDETATVANDMTLNTHLNIDDGNYTITTGSIIDNNGGSAYNIDVRGTGYFEVGGKVVIEGDLEVRNFGEFLLKGCDTMTVKGDVDFRNDTEVTIESCAVLIIEGDLNMRNDNITQVDGTVYVGGDLISRNFSSMTGTGNLETVGTITINNSSEIFGSTSGCSPGPCEYGSGVGLPVELSIFKAKFIDNNQIQFNWRTETETNNDYFTIEYSLDGKSFFRLLREKGSGNSQSPKLYERLASLETNKSIYVRLIQTDFDGGSKAYNAIYVKNSNLEDLDKKIVSVHPNPGNGRNFKLILKTNSIETNYVIEIRNISGELLLKDLIQTQEEMTYEKVFNKIQLRKGLYFISIISSKDHFVSKYIVV